MKWLGVLFILGCLLWFAAGVVWYFRDRSSPQSFAPVSVPLKYTNPPLNDNLNDNLNDGFDFPIIEREENFIYK